MKKILITGAAGFIGSNLAEKLISSGEIVGIDDFNDYYSPLIKKHNIKDLRNNPSFKIYTGDISDKKIISKIFQENRIDKIIHLAARAGVRSSLENPTLYMKVNFLGTQNILEAARENHVQQFIFASSSSVYGNNIKVPFSEDDQTDKPISPYAISKLAGEKLCWLYNNTYGLKTTVLRFFSVYGPKGRPDMAPFIFTKKILNHDIIDVYGDGSQARDFTYVDDITDGIALAMKKMFDFEIINLGNSYPISVIELIKTIEKVTGKNAQINFLPARLGDVTRTYANILKAGKILGYRPSTSFETGIKNFVDWYSSTI
jgi:UDP-glucuronate 4-epimerase